MSTIPGCIHQIWNRISHNNISVAVLDRHSNKIQVYIPYLTASFPAVLHTGQVKEVRDRLPATPHDAENILIN